MKVQNRVLELKAIPEMDEIIYIPRQRRKHPSEVRRTKKKYYHKKLK